MSRLILILALWLSACVPVPIVLPVGAPQQTAQPVQRLASTPPANTQFDAAFAQLRQNAGLPPLLPNVGLDRVAAGHAADMQAGGYVAHRDRQGRKVTDRVPAAGVSSCGAGENLAQGQDNAIEVLRDWARSTGHRANLLDPRYANYGFGRAGDSWVLVLLLPC